MIVMPRRVVGVLIGILAAFGVVLVTLLAVGYVPANGHGTPAHDQTFALIFGIAEGLAVALAVVIFFAVPIRERSTETHDRAGTADQPRTRRRTP